MPYTDDISKVMTFNPYVETVPIETLKTAGLLRQQRYDENLQRLQTTYQETKGLENQFYDSQFSSYFNSKMEGIKNSTREAITGDLSNQSLVSSIGGAIKSITNDKVVKQGLQDSIRIKQIDEEADKLRKEGKSDANNDNYWMNEKQKYLSTPIFDDEGKVKSFNGEYIPYVNIIKKMGEALEKIGERKEISEQLFITGEDGKPLEFKEKRKNPKTGLIEEVNTGWRYADVKTVKKMMNNENAVLATINNVLSEGSVQKQMNVNTWATYRNTPVESIINNYKSEADKKIAILDLEKQENTLLLQSTNLDKDKIEKITKRNELIEESKKELNDEFLKIQAYSLSNPEGMKRRIYESNFRNSLFNQFYKSDISNTVEDNPGKKAQLEDAKFRFDQQKESTRINQWNQEFSLRQDANKRDWMEFDMKYPIDPVTGNRYTSGKGGKIINPNDNKAFDASSSGTFEAIKEGEKLLNDLSSQKYQTALKFYLDITRKSRPDLANKSASEIEQNFKNVAKSQGITPEAWLDRWMNLSINGLTANGANPNPELSREISKYRNISKSFNNTSAAVQEIERQLNQEFDTKNYTINGKPVSLADIRLFEEQSNSVGNTFTLGVGGFLAETKGLKNEKNEAYSKLSKKFGESFNEEFKKLNFKNNFLKEYSDKKEKLYSEFLGVGQSATGSLTTASGDRTYEEKLKDLKAKIFAYVGDESTNRNYGTNTDKSKILDNLENITEVNYKVDKPTSSNRQWNPKLIIKVKDSKEPLIINLNETDFNNNFAKGEVILPTFREQPITDLSRLSKTSSTNLVAYPQTDKNAWKTSYYKTFDANPLIMQNGWGYNADVVYKNGEYYMYNYIKSPNSQEFKTVAVNTPFKSEYEADLYFKQLTPVGLQKLINK